MMQPQKDYGVEVITAYEFRRVGQVFYPPGMLRDALVRRGLVRRRTKEDVRAQNVQRKPRSPRDMQENDER